MANSKVEIANGALALLGDMTISSFEEENKQARACAFWYDRCRRMVLEEHDWNAAKKVIKLAQDASPDPDWTYKYALPADCIRLIRLDDETATFEVRGKYICTDLSNASALYVSDVQDASTFGPLLSDAISMRMAGKMAFSLTGDEGLVSKVETLFERQMAKARGSDSRLDAFKDFIPSDWVNARL